MAAKPSTTTAPADRSYFEWGPVIAGAIAAAALSVVLFQFGAAAGLSGVETVREDGSISWRVLVAGLWVVWMAIASAALGGYIAGRMRIRWPNVSDNEAELRDGLHGLVVWALSTLLATIALGVLAAVSAIGTAMSEGVTETPAAELVAIAANASVIIGFATAAGALLAAAVAFFFAILGGEHRDEDTDVNSLLPTFLHKAK